MDKEEFYNKINTKANIFVIIFIFFFISSLLINIISFYNCTKVKELVTINNDIIRSIEENVLEINDTVTSINDDCWAE